MEAEKQTALVPFITPTPGQIHLVVSHSSTPEKMLQFVSTVSLHQRLIILDCGNRSNMYTVAKLIRPFTPDPVGILNRIHLSRAFTCIQVLAMLKSTLALAPQEPLVIMDLLTTFLDEDLALPDARALLARSLDYIQGLSQHAAVVISMRPLPPLAQNRAVLEEDLRAFAGTIWEDAGPQPYSALPASTALQPALFA